MNPLFLFAQFARVAVPTLVIHGEKSEPLFQRAAQALVDVLPNARLHALEGQGHNVSFERLAPVLADFFAGNTPPRVQTFVPAEHAGQSVALRADS